MQALTKRFKQGGIWQRVFRMRAEDSLPHTVTHQRIYIVPSKRGAAFLLTLLLMLIASINYALSLGYALSFLLTGLFAASLLHTYRNLAGLCVNSITSDNTFALDDARFNISLQNNQARTRHGIRLSAQSGDCTRVRVDANDKAGATLAIKTQARGICKLGRLTLQSDWPLGLWTCWSYLHVHSQCLVYPQPEQDAPPLPADVGSQEGARSATSLQGDVAGLRDYQPGDSIGTIAWKSAARGLGLQSRTFDSEGALAHTALDLQRTGMANLEAQLSRLCAWVLNAESSRQDYTLHLAGFTLDKGHGREHRAQALAALASYAKGHASDAVVQVDENDKRVGPAIDIGVNNGDDDGAVLT